jgi:hypothetical protein
MSRSSLFVCIAVLAGTATIGWTAPPRPLPAFELVSLEGRSVADLGGRASGASVAREQESDGAQVVTAASIVRQGRWLLVYLSPDSGGSGPVLHALEGTDASAHPNLAIVVADRSAAKAMAKRFDGRVQAVWYADPDGAARRALGLTGVPVVLGLEGGEIRWTLSGAVADRRRLRSILVSWR